MKPGIYFGLPEDEYHPAKTVDGRKYLGSTAIVDLYHSPPDWQWEQLHDKPKKRVKHFDIGSGTHDLVLLGKDVFLEKNVRSPFKDFRTKEAQTWRDDTLAEGKVILTEDEFEQVVAAAGAILNSPNLQSEFQRGVPEVSVFCEIDGIPMKARFDYLKIAGCVDLKTFSEKFKQSLKRTVTQTISDRRYDVQACHYQAVRAEMNDLFSGGHVFGDKIPTEEWMSKMCMKQDPTWVWVFFKTTGAPVAFSVNAMNAPQMWEIAERTRARALENYKAFMEQFGPDEIWVEEIEPFVLTFEDLPMWFAND